ncbi:MAG: DUF4738 domain-containing protein [Alloprevotella sp.]
MKKCLFPAVLFLLLQGMAACGDKKSEGAVSPADSVQQRVTDDTPYGEPTLKNSFTAQWGGKSYAITIERQADPELPVVSDELGKKFYDNRVEVTILRDGEPFFHKSYSKEAFADFLSRAEQQGTVLLGMAYDSDKSDAHAIRLGAQIGQVGIEEGPAFCIEIPLDGSASSIVRDSDQDTTGDAGVED